MFCIITMRSLITTPIHHKIYKDSLLLIFYHRLQYFHDYRYASNKKWIPFLSNTNEYEIKQASFLVDTLFQRLLRIINLFQVPLFFHSFLWNAFFTQVDYCNLSFNSAEMHLLLLQLAYYFCISRIVYSHSFKRYGRQTTLNNNHTL